MYSAAEDYAARFIHEKAEHFRFKNANDEHYYSEFDIKRGLRNADGTGVPVGITRVASILGYYIEDGERKPMPGKLIYRGYNIEDIVDSFIAEDRFGYEETAYLLLFGELPTTSQLEEFNTILSDYRALPPRFTEDMILAAPSRNLMNKLSRSILALYSYDDNPETSTLENEFSQALRILARAPIVVSSAYAAKRHYFDGKSLYLHVPRNELSLAENFLFSIGRNESFSREDAKLLDLCLVLHAEHGGGNNSAFACRVLSSTGTDIYSSLAASVGSLKGPKHGGANYKAGEMIEDIAAHVSNWESDDEVALYLTKILQRDAFDRTGLIYGLGHAVYTVTDPRAEIVKRYAAKLAEEKGQADKLELIKRVERLGPEVMRDVRGITKPISTNIDMYTGFVYSMLRIPQELFTPIFAIARMAGWAAHRMEELYGPARIIRPAYNAVMKRTDYTPLAERG